MASAYCKCPPHGPRLRPSPAGDAVLRPATGILPGHDAYPFLTSSNLSTTSLGEIWAIADPDNNGFLTRDGWYKAARLIGWLQKGGATNVEETLLAKRESQTTRRRPAHGPASLGKHHRVCFASTHTHRPSQIHQALCRCRTCQRFGEWRQGERHIRQKNLADTQGRGSLDLTDFIIGMHLIQSCMANSALVLPATLPPGIYETASGSRPAPAAAPISPVVRNNTGPASPMRQQYTGGGAAPLQQQGTGGSIGATSAPIPPARSFTTSSAFAPPSRQMSIQNPQWDVTPQAKTTSDGFFSQLDPQNKGVIDGDVAVPFMLQSQLDEATLANVWDLADIRKEGKLTRDEFAVAMHLINLKLAGQEIPTSLPVSLVPPSLREEYGPGKQEVLQSSATKDLFDLFADEPPASASKAASPAPPQPQASTPAAAQPPALPARNLSQQPQPPAPQTSFLPQPPPPPSRRQASHLTPTLSPTPTGQQPSSFQGSAFTSPFSTSPAPAAAPASAPVSRGGGDLLSDDAETSSTPVPDHSAELGNKQNQLSQTTRSITDLSNQRTELEGSDKSSKQQLEELESKLAAAREKHQTELRAVADLRIRVGEQQAKVKKMNADLITASSDLSALQSEKTELEQALLHDKEEVRSLQKRMKEVDDEKQGLVLVLEKLRKEARQQKGMVSIAKKQVSTAEGARDGVQAEVKGVEKEIEEDKAFLVQHEKNQAQQQQQQQQQQQARALSPQSTGTYAAGIALPTTPQALSPTGTGMSNRSNNPFDRFLANGRSSSHPQVPSSTAATVGSMSSASTSTSQTPPQAPAPVPASAAEESTDKSFSPGSPVADIAETTSSAFGSVGAAATAAVGAVAAGAAGLYETAKHAVTDEPEHDPHLDTSSSSTAPPPSTEVADIAAAKAVEENNLNVKQDVAEQEIGPLTGGEGEGQQKQEQDPFGAPSSGFGFVGEDDKTPIAQQEELDPFGAPQIPSTTITSTAGAETNKDEISTDPFGVPQTETSSEQQKQAAGSQDQGFNDFEEGFDDSFGATGTTATAIAPAEKAVAGAEQETNKAPTDFDSAFAEFDSPAEAHSQSEQQPQESTLSPNEGIPSGIPKSELPINFSELPEAERTFSTQATIAPESEPITPMTEVPGEYRPREEESSGIPSSRGSTPGLAGIGATAVAVGAGVGVGSTLAHEYKPEHEGEEQQVQEVNAGESSDEDEGPEDLEGPRKGYGTKGAESSVTSPAEQQPLPTSAGAAAALAPPIAGFMTSNEDSQPKVRRSAPPPPTKSTSASSALVANPAAPAPATESETVSPVVATAGGINPGEEFDPFGAPMVASANAALGNVATTQGASYVDAPSMAASQAHAKTASFDEDEFDFSDLPPAEVESGIPVAAAQQATANAGETPTSAGFEDEFATFDDEFEKPEDFSAGNGSENSSGNKSYEIVNPQPKSSGLYDEWGFGSSARRESQPQEQPSQPSQNQQGAFGFDDAFGTQTSQGTREGGLSFDDAFGNDFEPSSSARTQEYAPPAGAPPQQQGLRPPMPERRPSGAQADDIEDVKKLCAMGFPRELVVEALAANGYDFQKTLNVLLA
ncbi:UBA/TS-N domain-containing protein [Cryptococcus gattii E566]|nr:UBA/TS-N domain-containing protein [Cryptococcus gattii E566]